MLAGAPICLINKEILASVGSCEGPHSDGPDNHLELFQSSRWSKTISKDQPFSDCVVLGKDAFDPDAVFLDDIVDDDVLPRLTLAVDGLNDAGDRARSQMEMRPEDAANEEMTASTSVPTVAFDPEQLEVYGWESSIWRKLKGYMGI